MTEGESKIPESILLTAIARGGSWVYGPNGKNPIEKPVNSESLFQIRLTEEIFQGISRLNESYFHQISEGAKKS